MPRRGVSGLAPKAVIKRNTVRRHFSHLLSPHSLPRRSPSSGPALIFLMTTEAADRVSDVGERRGVTDVAEMKARSCDLRRRSVLCRSDYKLGEKLFQRRYAPLKDSDLLRTDSRLALRTSRADCACGTGRARWSSSSDWSGRTNWSGGSLLTLRAGRTNCPREARWASSSNWAGRTNWSGGSLRTGRADCSYGTGRARWAISAGRPSRTLRPLFTNWPNRSLRPRIALLSARPGRSALTHWTWRGSLARLKDC